MKDLGFVLMAVGAFFTALIGAIFYDYLQRLLAASGAAASGSSTTLTNALSIYNSTANTPILITIAIFAFAFLILGGIFFAVGSVGQMLLDKLEASPLTGPESDARRPSRACVKCGALLYQSVGYCPNCGSSLATLQTSALSPTPPKNG
jgi:hypothetical protein